LISGFIAMSLVCPAAWAQDKIGSAQGVEGNAYVRHGDGAEFKPLAKSDSSKTMA
jgi:hypothetical protein